MAHYCPCCEYLFSAVRINCPFCGGRVISDSRTDEELLAEGYTWPSQPGAEREPVRIEIQDDDIISQLQSSYQKRYEQSSRQENSGAAGGMRQEAGRGREEGDFFGDLAQNIRESGASPQPQQDAGFTEEEPSARQWEAARREHERTRQTILWGEILDGLRYRLPWGVIFRGLLVIGVVLFFVWLWSMRFAIAAAIWDFVMALLPSFIVIAIIVAVIRSWFHR